MTRTDTAVVGALVVLLALIAGLVGIPRPPATTAHAQRRPAARATIVRARRTARASSAIRSRSAR